LSNRLNESYWRGSRVNRCNRLACAHVLQFVVFFLNLMNQFFFVALHRFLHRGPSPRFVGRPLIEIFFIFFSIMFRFPPFALFDNISPFYWLKSVKLFASQFVFVLPFPLPTSGKIM
jgi:hypothetical protein